MHFEDAGRAYIPLLLGLTAARPFLQRFRPLTEQLIMRNSKTGISTPSLLSYNAFVHTLHWSEPFVLLCIHCTEHTRVQHMSHRLIGFITEYDSCTC